MSTGFKVCGKCQTEKPVGEFSRDRSKKDGICSKCKICAKVAAIKWAAENPERKKANDTAHQEKRHQFNADEERNRRKVWRENNPSYARKYLEENRAAHTARVALRGAVKLRATPTWANSLEISAIYDRARKVSVETGVVHEVDHVVPLRSRYVCGLHCESNLQILTKVENRAKRNIYWPDMPKGL